MSRINKTRNAYSLRIDTVFDYNTDGVHTPVIGFPSQAKADNPSSLGITDKNKPVFIDKNGLMELLNLKEKTINNMIKKGILPEPIYLPTGNHSSGTRGRKIYRWRTNEVIECVSQY